MWDVIGTVLTGGATGLIGTVIGKGFSFVDNWQKEKEMEAQMQVAEIGLRQASYSHDQSAGQASQWATNILRLVRPGLTFGLIVLVGIIYFRTDDIGQQETIIQSVIYMASSSVLWWFGDRALRSKK